MHKASTVRFFGLRIGYITAEIFGKYKAIGVDVASKIRYQII